MKRMKLGILLSALIAMVVLVNCNQREAETVDEFTFINASEQYMDGLSIIEQTCMNCHSPDLSHDDRIAPPLIAVKDHYMEEGMTEEEFVDQVSTYLLNPNEDDSKMPGAVRRFGVMPNLGMSEKQYRAVATYIYHAELEKPNWYEDHFKKEHGAMQRHRRGHGGGKGHGHGQNGEQSVDYLKKGQQLALATKAVLGSNLLGSIQSKGTAGALEFCNERAIPLTDSMATRLHADIRRVSDNNRNPNNLANEMELAYIMEAKKEIEKEGSASSKLQDLGDHMVGYYPIVTNAMCLQCHGTPGKEINEETLTQIQKLYPEDKATGYSANQLRGIWVVTMAKED